MAEVKVPSLGESIVEATVGQWLKREGDAVESGETIAELETDKVNVEVIAEQAGVLSSILKQAGEMVGIGDVIAVISEGAAAPAGVAQTPVAQPAQAAPAPAASAPAEPKAAAPAQAVPPAAPSTVRATPSVRRAALEQGVDLGQLQTGRIEIADLARVASAASTSAPSPQSAPRSPIARMKRGCACRVGARR
ncbi:hypothetical protein GCM10025858_08370 [Alicyclobacillus sacchari]|nr:hypothetical protein GCM10025858_08370 [Alicyclobacillus sacchari]